jgi:predicted membrane protein
MPATGLRYSSIKYLGVITCTILAIPLVVITLLYLILENDEYNALNLQQKLFINTALATVILLFISNVFLKNYQ